ncbi:uncharacterized protein TNCV_3528401 [Trichonephila clavipes]|nr:uncharacterized protein TNCV_3528401 [Trichonephila clavipes]
MAPHIITAAVGEVCRCKAKAGLMRSPRALQYTANRVRPLRGRTRLSSLLRLSLDSHTHTSLKTTWYLSAASQFPHAQHHSKWRHRWVGVKGSTLIGCLDSKFSSSRCLRMVRKDTGPLVKMLPVLGWRSMLAVRVHFLRCGGLLDDWSIEGVLSLVFV